VVTDPPKVKCLDDVGLRPKFKAVFANCSSWVKLSPYVGDSITPVDVSSLKKYRSYGCGTVGCYGEGRLMYDNHGCDLHFNSGTAWFKCATIGDARILRPPDVSPPESPKAM